MSAEWLTDGLSVLGGADLDVLKHAKSERSAFVGIGLVMLGTASVAALSMMFALHNAVLVVTDPTTGGPAADQPTGNLILAVILGLVWGALILVLDRALIKTMQGVAGPKAIAYATPRFVLAVIIGVVVSTPITLQVFHSEIAAQVKLDQDTAISEMQEHASDSSVTERLAQVKEQIAAQESILKGEVELSSPELDAAQGRYDVAVQAEESARADQEQKYRAMICERTGAGASHPECQGIASDVPGEGDLFLARQREYNDAYALWESAKGELSAATADMASAQEAANAANKETVAQAQLQAGIELCGKDTDTNGQVINPPVADPDCRGGLRAEAEGLQASLDGMQNGDLIRQQSGLLAQIVALGKISDKDAEAAVAHLFVALLFMVIELLPVIIKTFIAVRGVTQYDRIAKKLQDDEFEEVSTETEERAEQRDRESKKTKAIRDDMLSREVALGKTANDHVASEMEAILRSALTDWSSKVHQTLAANPATPGKNQSQNTTATNPYNLPDGSQI